MIKRIAAGALSVHLLATLPLTRALGLGWQFCFIDILARDGTSDRSSWNGSLIWSGKKLFLLFAGMWTTSMRLLCMSAQQGLESSQVLTWKKVRKGNCHKSEKKGCWLCRKKSNDWIWQISGFNCRYGERAWQWKRGQTLELQVLCCPGIYTQFLALRHNHM